MNSLQQQAKFDAFLHEFNTERPHEALAMKCLADVYKPSTRTYRGLPELSYPFHDREIPVTNCGRICLHRKKINLSTVFAGQNVGIKEVDDAVFPRRQLIVDLRPKPESYESHIRRLGNLEASMRPRHG